MRPRLATTVAFFHLSMVGSVLLPLLPAGLGVQEAVADTLRVPGVIRDFHKSDAAYTAAPSAGNGHYAGNIAQTLGNDNRPVFTGAGYKVATQWKDMNTRPIAPHMYMYQYGSPGQIPVAIATPTPGVGIVNTYNSDNGPYGGSNVGPAATYLVGAPMPEIVIPLSLKSVPSVGDLTISGSTTVLFNDLHCNKLTVSDTLRIGSNVSILCEDLVTLNNNAVIALNPGARLKLYMKNGGMSWNHVTVGDPAKPSRVTIYNFGTAQFGIHNQAQIYANFVSPNASLYIYNQAEFFGRFIGKTVEFNNHAGFHIDNAVPRDLCDVALADTAGTAGALSTSGIGTAANFTRWYTDTLGSNMSANYSLDLTNDGTGVYEFLDDEFNPIDGQLFGNEGDSHNYYFTYTFQVLFTHHACAGEFFEFQGSDDVWVFLDGRLVLDIGGVLPGTSQRVNLDRVDLVDGRTYQMNFFYAQRNSALSTFGFQTNMDLICDQPIQTASAAID
ncbi:MAG: fibro-slime domain-containing protein [Phycisphaerales bacterium]|nr:fibro-slime domain-containing protein [Phycisphaerales bacterium]